MTIQELDDPTDDDDVASYRARARNLLSEITRQIRQALDNAGISLDVFVMIPSSGDAIATFGTAADPAVEVWDRASKIISSIVGESVGLARTRCREVACASTGETIPALRRDAEMRYRDLARDRFRVPPSHPILAEVTIDPVDWFRFQQLDEDNPAPASSATIFLGPE